MAIKGDREEKAPPLITSHDTPVIIVHRHSIEKYQEWSDVGKLVASAYILTGGDDNDDEEDNGDELFSSSSILLLLFFFFSFFFFFLYLLSFLSSV